MRAIILFAHGARDPEWARPFHRIQALIRTRLPGTPIELAFLEMMKPNLSSAIDAVVAQGVTAITVVPLFMAQGGHLREDVPRLIQQIKQSHPSVAVSLTSPIGEVEAILHQIAEWVVLEHNS
jgi:sirohydrochlorin cobaltochelatase